VQGQIPVSSGNLFLKGTLILTVGGMVVKVIGSLNWIFLSRILGGEGIGLYQMAFPLYLLALNISSAGLPVAISILTAERIALNDIRGAKRVFHLSLALLTVTGLVLSAALFLSASWLIDFHVIRDPRAYYSLIALSPAIFFVTILASFRGYLQGWQIMTPTAVSQIIEQIIRVAAMLIFAGALLPMGLAYAAGGASLGAAAGSVAGLLALLYYYRRLPARFSGQSECAAVERESGKKIMKRLVSLAWPVSLSSIMLPLVANLDLIVVPLRLEKAGYSVGQATELFGYLTGMAVPLVNLATILTASLAISLVPAISASHSLGDIQGVRQKLSAAFRLTYLVAIPGVVILFLLAEQIAGIVYNAPQAGGSIRILALSVFFLGLHQISTGALQGMGLTLVPVLNMGLAAIIKVFLNWTLTAVPWLGIEGAAWATVADIGLAACLNIYWVRRNAEFTMGMETFFKSVIAAFVMGLVMVLSYGYLENPMANAIVVTLITFVSGCLIYSVMLLTLGAIGERDIVRIPLVGSNLCCMLRKLKLLRQ